MSGKIFKKIALSTGIGTGIGMIFSSLTIVIMALVLSVGDIPAMLIAPATVFAVAVGGFIGGFVSAKLCGEKGLLCGLISGVIFVLFLWIFGTIFGSGEPGIGIAIKILLLILAGSFGGIIGVNYIKRK